MPRDRPDFLALLTWPKDKTWSANCPICVWDFERFCGRLADPNWPGFFRRRHNRKKNIWPDPARSRSSRSRRSPTDSPGSTRTKTKAWRSSTDVETSQSPNDGDSGHPHSPHCCRICWSYSKMDSLSEATSRPKTYFKRVSGYYGQLAYYSVLN